MYLQISRILLSLSLLLLLISGCSSGGSGGGGGAPTQSGAPSQGSASLSADGTSLVFKNSFGNIILAIPLLSQSSIVSKTNGDLMKKVHETTVLSDDGSHAGVYTSIVNGLVSDLEGSATSSFRYYDSSGQLWQITAPDSSGLFPAFYSGLRSITPNGSRVMLVSVGEGISDPILFLYDVGGNLIFQSPEGAFEGFYDAELSPNGRYLLIMATVPNGSGSVQDLLRVYDTVTRASYDFPFDIAAVGKPAIKISGDGRFQITYQSNQQVLPP